MSNAPDFRHAAMASEAALVIDARLRICNANDAAHSLLGYRPGTLQDVSLAWLLPPARQGLLSELRAAQRNGGRLRVAAALMREDGGLVGVVLTTHACTHGDERALAVELMPDDDPTLTRIRNSQTFALAQPANAQRSAAPPPVPAKALTDKSLPTPTPATLTSAHAAPSAVCAQLSTCLDLLRWLDTQVLDRTGQDSPKQRALARVVLHQAEELLEECRAALNVHSH